MKSFINRLFFCLSAIRWPGNKSNRKKKLIFCIASILLGVVCLSGCFHYYATNRVHSTDAETIQKLMMNGKYFILHTNEQNMELTRIQLNNENLEADVNTLVPEHQNYLHPKSITTNKFKETDQDKVLLEVHLYTHSSVAGKSHVSVPLKDFYQMDVYELNEKATARSKRRTIISVSLATAGVALLVVAVISLNNDLNSTSSTPSQSNSNNSNSGGSWGEAGCSPQVYAVSGTESKLAGILYSGAIFAPLQRTDYLPLSGVEVNNGLHLQIQGGRNEELFIHEAKLVTVTHDKEDNVLFDHHGKALVYRQPVKPEKAFIGSNQDIKKAILETDENCYSFTNQSQAGQNTSDILLDFKKPAGIHSGKLIIRAKNSSWATYLFKKFKSLYGDSYAGLVQRKDKADRKKLLQCELDQSLPLSVSVKDGDSWRFVDYFYTPGNEAFRDMIMELNLADLHTDHLQIKLETTYMFWELDYAGMDFSANHSCNITYTPANCNPWQHCGSQLNVPDADGNIHLSDKEHLDLDFTIKPITSVNLINSYFLAGSGYYHDNTRFAGRPQLNKLAAFSQKGAFDKFSRETFSELMALIKSNSANNIAANN